MNLRSIRDQVSVYRHLYDAQAIKVDNFPFIGKILKMNYDGAQIYLEILRRFKDNPQATDIPNRYNDLVKNYWFDSINDLLAAKDEIVSLCESRNARAYIFVNTRSKRDIENYMSYLLSRGNRYHGKPLRFDPKTSASRANWDTPKRSIVIVDVDTTLKQAQEEVRQILKDHGFNPMHEYITPSGGLHIVIDDKRVADIDWEEYGFGSKSLYSMIDVLIDRPCILYANLNSDLSYDKYEEVRMKHGIQSKYDKSSGNNKVEEGDLEYKEDES